MGIGALVLFSSSVYTFIAGMHRVVAAKVVAALPSSSTATQAGIFETLLLLHLRFACGVAGEGGMPPIWESVA